MHMILLDHLVRKSQLILLDLCTEPIMVTMLSLQWLTVTPDGLRHGQLRIKLLIRRSNIWLMSIYPVMDFLLQYILIMVLLGSWPQTEYILVVSTANKNRKTE